MALTGRSGWKFITSDGKDLSAPALQQAELIKGGDLIVFNYQTQLLQIRRFEVRKQIVVSEIHSSVIDNENTFRLLAENIRDVSRLELVEALMTPSHCWALRLI
ncbi:MAG: hypothetical protein A2735_02305 [Candidatus Yanofskybacteria bacterium RIFCSPHIGHO2_01_FULL_41_21]|uniref:Uncharacterized protein n=2 Tax=Candidatus Yanofskyibacteriota TaxID=1752733 RepID=A0A0G0WNA5_9BACT|nr:MAG: hypothetical protein UU70_C0013G0006 [Candidatus Yanofskybacteria bacterium GW2011_GWA1_41_6]OGM97977.1 MAG: hypothetical protein A2735_02305 [Candidatus Yanofskybacteria bacterium RIFCSPHIGHO2_01_FULL_41_21]